MTNRVVIVVDDNLASRMLPAIILRSLPLQVFECETAEGIWPLLAQHDVSHVLLDISMPGAGGVEVAQKIREEPLFANVKLVAYTADARMAQAEWLATTGFGAVLIKPIKRFDLLEALDLAPPHQPHQLDDETRAPQA
jgi:CheY-like chemotaxis protein